MSVQLSASPAPRLEVATVYAVGLFQGISLVAFPAAATILTSPAGYGLSKGRYGWMFLPQVMLAIAGSLALPVLSRRFSLKQILIAGLLADTLAMALFVASDPLRGQAAAYPLLLAATASLGLGFGLTLGCISTYAGAFMPDRRDVALTALNVLLGLGTALSLLLVALFTEHGQWWYLPSLAASGLAALVVASALQHMVVPVSKGAAPRSGIPRAFWLFAIALVLYGIGETMFGNWGTTLLIGGGVSAKTANDGLAAFWAAVTIGRLLIAVVSTRIHSSVIYLALPWAMAATLLLIPLARSASTGIACFTLGGSACSGFFPMTVGYGESSFPGIVELAAGWLIASYQLGYGLAAFGGGALQSVVSLATVFRLAALLALVMGVLAVPIARRQHRSSSRTVQAPSPAAPAGLRAPDRLVYLSP